MFEELLRKSLVIKLIEKMQEADSWTGETHIQKSIYFLQEFFEVPVGYKYILYKHGPFSFDLRNELTEMRADSFLETKPKDPYGASFYPGSYAETIIRNNSDDVNEYEDYLNFVVERVSNNTVRKLERLATALYVRRHEGIEERERIIEKVIELKPHISKEEAERAVELLYEFMEEGRELELL